MICIGCGTNTPRDWHLRRGSNGKSRRVPAQALAPTRTTWPTEFPKGRSLRLPVAFQSIVIVETHSASCPQNSRVITLSRESKDFRLSENSHSTPDELRPEQQTVGGEKYNETHVHEETVSIETDHHPVLGPAPKPASLRLQYPCSRSPVIVDRDSG